MPRSQRHAQCRWSPEEDQLIMAMLNTIGPRWAKLADALPGRSVPSIRNRWQRIDRGYRAIKAGQISKVRCAACGEPKQGHVCFARLRENQDPVILFERLTSAVESESANQMCMQTDADISERADLSTPSSPSDPCFYQSVRDDLGFSELVLTTSHGQMPAEHMTLADRPAGPAGSAGPAELSGKQLQVYNKFLVSEVELMQTLGTLCAE